MNIINTRSILILTAILVFGVLVTMGLVSQSTSDTKAAEGATGLAAKRTKPDRATQNKPPTVNLKKRDSQSAAGEKFDSSEIRQAFSELQALKEGGGSNQQIQEKEAAIEVALEKAGKKDRKGVLELLEELELAAEKKDESSENREIRQALSELLALQKGSGSEQQIQEKKAALKAAIERGIKQDSESVLKFLFGFTQVDNAVYGPDDTLVSRSFIQRAPELAVALLDQVPDEFGLRILAESIGSGWADSDLKAALAWANQQTDSKIKDAILEGVIPSWAKTDLKGALAYAQSLPPGDSQDRTISKVFENVAQDDQGALAMMQSLPEGRTKDLATKGISEFMAENNPQAAFDLASGIDDSDLRMRAEEKVLLYLKFWSKHDLRAPAAATQWMQSLPVGDTKDMLSEGISRPMAARDPQAAFDIATGIGDSDRRTEAQKNVVEQWFQKDPAAATQWINRSTLPQEVKTQLLPR